MKTEILSIEAKIAHLEKQLKRQKLSTLALFVGAVVAVSAPRVVSQTAPTSLPTSLSLRTLRIVGPDGKTKVLLSGNPSMNKDGGSIAILDNREKVRLGLMAVAQGGSATIYHEDGEPMAILGYDGEGGSLKMAANGSKTQVDLAATKEVSGLVVSGPNGKKHFVAGADSKGGLVQVFGVEGQLKQQMP